MKNNSLLVVKGGYMPSPEREMTVSFLDSQLRMGEEFIHNGIKYEVDDERIYYHAVGEVRSERKWFNLKFNGTTDVGQLYSPGADFGRDWQTQSKELVNAVGGMLERSGFMNTVPGNLLVHSNHDGYTGQESFIEIPVVKRGGVSVSQELMYS